MKLIQSERGFTTEGIYKHYKGGLYEVIGEGIHKEAQEPLIFYYDDMDNFFARPTEMFKGSLEVDGKIVKRFIKD